MDKKRQRELEDLNVLLSYLKHTRGDEWEIEDRPDETSRNDPACDFIVRSRESSRRAAVEVTSFDWPMDRRTVAESVRRLCQEVSVDLGGRIVGDSMVAIDLIAVRRAGLFARKNRENTKQGIVAALTEERMMQVGETREIAPMGLTVTRLRDSRDPYIGVTSVTHTDFKTMLDDLEKLVRDQVEKLRGRAETAWLLISFPGIGGILEIIGPVVKVPREIDELFFIDYKDPSPGWPPNQSVPAVPRIVEYANAKSPNHGGTFDRETGALKVIVP